MGDDVITMLMGGPADGRVLEVPDDRDAWLYPIPSPETATWPMPLPYETYQYKKIATPDRWIQVVYVWDKLVLESVTEAQMIHAIMSVWRARHRR